MFLGPVGANQDDIAGANFRGVSFQISHGDFMVGVNKTQIDPQRLPTNPLVVLPVKSVGQPTNPVQGDFGGGLAIRLDMLGKIDMRASVQQHLNFTGLPETGTTMVTG